MKIRKKIVVWCALFALLVALVPPSSAKANSTETNADDVKYRDIEDFMLSAGYTGFEKKDNCVYMVFDNGTNLNVVEFSGFVEGKIPYACVTPNFYGYFYIMPFSNTANDKVTFYKYYNYSNASKYDNYSCLSVTNGHNYSGRTLINDVSNCYFYFRTDSDCRFSYLVYSDIDVYSNDSSTATNFIYQFSDVMFESSKSSVYSFPSWCEDAGLNSISSSNESPSVIPYSYNSYWHIVRKTSTGKWLLTTIGSTIGQGKMSLRLSEDCSRMKIYEYSGEDSFTVSVRQCEYDFDGWKVRTNETYGYDDFSSGIVELPLGTGINSTVGLAYTSTDIYTGDGLSVYVSASTEYFEPIYLGVAPPAGVPTPTPIPEGGIAGGSMITYKPALSGEVIVDSLNMRKEASTDSEAVAAFIKTWSLTLHGYVQNEEGVWYFCTAERDGQVYTGYVLSEYVEIVGGSVGSDSGSSTLDETLAQAVTELESLAIFVARVPMIIGIIFSFMPAWCLGLLGLAFIFLVLRVISGR